MVLHTTLSRETSVDDKVMFVLANIYTGHHTDFIKELADFYLQIKPLLLVILISVLIMKKMISIHKHSELYQG